MLAMPASLTDRWLSRKMAVVVFCLPKVMACICLVLNMNGLEVVGRSGVLRCTLICCLVTCMMSYIYCPMQHVLLGKKVHRLEVGCAWKVVYRLVAAT